jgi:hypothetical protein
MARKPFFAANATPGPRPFASDPVRGMIGPLATEPAMLPSIDPVIAAGVVLATAATDAVYVMFTAAVVARRRAPAATWSAIWYMLSSFAVISYTNNWMYVLFAAIGSWIGAYLSITYLHGTSANPSPPRGPAA